jgi:hypothetical protein
MKTNENIKNQELEATGLYQISFSGGSPEITRVWNGASFVIETQSDRDNGNFESFQGSEIANELKKAEQFLVEMYNNEGWVITMDNVSVSELTEYNPETENFEHAKV